MTTPFDLGDKVAIVTGSSRSIGRASAEAMARLGAKVVVSSRKADACEAMARGIALAHSCLPHSIVAARETQTATLAMIKP